MDATPALLRPTQSPLAASACTRILHRSRLTPGFHDRVRPDFPSLSRLPIAALSPHGSRPLAKAIHLLALSPCEVDGILRYGCYPCVVPANAAPPGRQPPAPGSCYFYRARFDFPQLSLLPIGRFHLAAPGACSRPFTCFRFAPPCEVGDILRYGCYPCVVRAYTEPPGRRPPAPGSPIRRHGPLPG